MKLERLISMIYMLLNNEILSASALAEKYNVSQRTIYRDIDAICAAGIPVVSYQGVNGGFGIIDTYKMDKSLLGSYDVGSLVTILHSMSTVFDDEKAQETINKLQTLQNDSGMPSLSMDIGSQHAYNEYLRIIRNAIKERKVIRFEYINAKSERASRDVEPASLLLKYDSWYLFGYCRTRSDYREFKLSRIAELTALGEHYTRKHEAPIYGERLQQNYRPEAVQEDAVLHFKVETLARALDFFYNADKTYQEDGSLIIELRVTAGGSERWLIPILLSFGDGVEVLEPPTLRERMKEKIKKMVRIYPEV
ncbi:helix-turn-helix transcriptional regulator [Paenibacillus harenae]|uniref:helix-turn-helix transcriptional regulator n=1 Tax=Paenibacillus harenae TaxID=306543 RepID=UPI00278F52A5|nr:YafY family protein [Paenibacillus harenae]MDQ0057910.1 putative DNA-binding transcriptional regulator YafY [Paenibacillus harenae]